MADRISFEEAIGEKLLLRKRFLQLSLPQRTSLKIAYGCPLVGDELDVWAVFNEHCTLDELGYPTSIQPLVYVPQVYEVITLVWGRRSGKTDAFSSLALAYEAALGGHEEHIRKGATAVCFLLAQDLTRARENLPLIELTLESSPLLRKEIVEKTAVSVRLKNNIVLSVAPANAKAVRGYAIPAISMDEVGLWYTEQDSANPDIEVDRAIRFAQGQFPNRKKIVTSTPWTKEGLLWRHYQAGTNGMKLRDAERKGKFKKFLCLHASTAAMRNPLIDREWLKQEQTQDPEAFERECLARFTDSRSGFLTEALLERCKQTGIAEHPPLTPQIVQATLALLPQVEREVMAEEFARTPMPHYVAAMDPAFRKDSFSFTIVHNSEHGVVQDVVRRWTPLFGEKLNPDEKLAEMAQLLASYKISVVYSDQYQLESLQQLALQHGFAIEGVDFTSKSKARIMGSLQQLVNQRRLKLLDPALSEAAAETYKELVKLERRLLPAGGVQIAAPKGQHDDMATVLALAVYKATWLAPTAPKNEAKEPTMFEKIFAHAQKKWRARRNEDKAWD